MFGILWITFLYNFFFFKKNREKNSPKKNYLIHKIFGISFIIKILATKEKKR